MWTNSLPPGLSQRADALQQVLVVAHVLEHLDRDDAIEPVGVQLEQVDVGGDDLDIAEAAFAAARLDEFALRTRIGDGRDARVRKSRGHPQRQRAPAAAEFEDMLAVGEFGALAVEAEHARLGGIEIGRGFVPVAGAVFEVAAEAEREECRRQFVVLGVRRVGLDRDRAARAIRRCARADARPSLRRRRRSPRAVVPRRVRRMPSRNSRSGIRPRSAQRVSRFSSSSGRLP